MARRTICPQTASLLEWEPPKVAEGFSPDQVQAATLEGKLARALRVCMSDSGIEREDIAAAMRDWLGENNDGDGSGSLSKAMLDNYTAQGKRTHVINVVRLVALCAVTGDIRPLALLVEELGWAVVEPRHVRLVRAIILEEKAQQLTQAAAVERRAAR